MSVRTELRPRLRRSSIICCVAMAVFALPGSAVRAANAELPKTWQGKYFYTNATPPVTFELKITSQQGQDFTGRTTESATFGTKPCSFLYATITGRVVGNSIQFTKTYDGTCGQKHSVYYSGIIDQNAQNIWGSWKIGEDATGMFTAEADQHQR
jgi:hypothetical protein